MPDRREIEAEVGGRIAEARAQLAAAWEQVRHPRLKALSELSGRDVILYAGDANSAHPAAGIFNEDVEGFMAALRNLKGRKLDLILHSNGGDVDAAEQIGNYLRAKYAHIRAIVPQNAMSAATMLACACDEIVMGKHSAIGPVDPQILIPASGGGGYIRVPALRVLEEFDQARLAAKNDPESVGFWISRMDYPPGTLSRCQNAIDLSINRVEEWLKERMLQAAPRRAEKAAQWLAVSQKDHGRPLNYNAARKAGLIVTALEKDQKLQDAALAVFHATTISLKGARELKIIENQLGMGFRLRARNADA